MLTRQLSLPAVKVDPFLFLKESAFALDLFGFGVYPFPPGAAAGALSFHDPLEGTEI
jgi:hypothetical protein